MLRLGVLSFIPLDTLKYCFFETIGSFFHCKNSTNRSFYFLFFDTSGNSILSLIQTDLLNIEARSFLDIFHLRMFEQRTFRTVTVIFQQSIIQSSLLYLKCDVTLLIF